ncbi:MAG: helix-turn-helix domain-containing protein [Lactobacillus sp.]|nr:helix-turn-helix domain-containing protein [Lactobacillus sp.]MDN6052452.1 helix-turn-helix domain-containing protein [Lactobacillus sp.]
MAAVELVKYLASLVQATTSDQNELKLPAGNSQLDLFTLYLENHNRGVHQLHAGSASLWYVLAGTANLRSVTGTGVALVAGHLLLTTGAFAAEMTSQSDDAVLVKLRFKTSFSFSHYFAHLAELGGQEQQVLKKLVDQLGRNQYLHLTGGQLAGAGEYLQALINDYLNVGLFAKAAIDARLTLALISAFKSTTLTPANQHAVKFARSELDRYIDAHYRKVTLAEAAKYFSFNPNYFSNLVKKQTGSGFVAHVNQRRMLQARKLLAQPNVSLHDIIGMVGYSSKSFFYKKFNAYYGMTPAAMRKKLFREANINLN